MFSLFKKTRGIAGDNAEMNNVIDSMFNGEPLYNELKVKCHPDLFLEDKQKEYAQHLFQQLQKSRHDINAMKQLKPEIDTLYQNRYNH